MLVLGLLLRRQLFGLFACLATLLLVGQKHFWNALIGKVCPPCRLRILTRSRALLIKCLVGQGAGIARLNGDDFAVLVRNNLRLDGVALLFAGVKLALGVGQTGPGDGRLKAVHQNHVQRIGMPGGFAFGPLLFGIPSVSRAEVAQKLHCVVKAVFADVRADAEHLADDGMRDVVAQVDQSKQHFLVGEELASSTAAGAALSARLCSLLGQSPGHEFGQDSRQKLAEGSVFQAKKGANTVFRKRLQLRKVHALIFGKHETYLYYTEHLMEY